MWSKIANYIVNHKDTWVEDFKALGIYTHELDNYIIFNYDITCDFSNELVREARGIILNKVDLQCVCVGFNKFGNYYETYVDTIDWNSAEMQQKIDGSILKLWYDKNEWHWSTNGMIDANESHTKMDTLSFGQLLRMAVNYKDIPFDKLNKDYTYIFEIVSPLHKIVIEYPTTKLYHLGTRNNITGQELIEDIGIIKPLSMKINSLEDCIEAAKKLNADELSEEGYVVVDKDFHRIKVKSPVYLLHHKMVSTALKKEDAIYAIITNTTLELDSFNEMIYKYYDYKLTELLYQMNQEMKYAKAIYEEANFNRKAAASEIKKMKFSALGFFALDNNDATAIDFFKNKVTNEYNIIKLANYIDTYASPYFTD